MHTKYIYMLVDRKINNKKSVHHRLLFKLLFMMKIALFLFSIAEESITNSLNTYKIFYTSDIIQKYI